ncbi:MAG: hypothetical protein DSY59_02665 [Persephonella sp.]|nr:MAG: hypothetical protein DSY59_02665 [Persephonella sp.]
MKIEGLIIDLDGVLTKDKALTPFEDAPKFIEFLKEKNIRFKIATNNSLYSPSQLVEGLRKNGIDISLNQLITPLVVIPDYLNSRNLKNLFVIGSKELKNFFKQSGFNVKNSTDVDAVVIGQDKEFNFEKMKIATTSIKENNAEILALNKNLITKDDNSLLFPGVGSVSNMFAYATKKDFIHFGKNSKEYNKKLLEYFNSIPLNEIAILSDDLFTDLKPFKELGLFTIFITTGKYKKEDITEEFKPDLVVNSLTEVVKILDGHCSEVIKDDKTY